MRLGLFLFCFLPQFSKDSDASGLAPLFLLIGSKVINVVYSAALVCIPVDYVKQFFYSTCVFAP